MSLRNWIMFAYLDDDNGGGGGDGTLIGLLKQQEQDSLEKCDWKDFSQKSRASQLTDFAPFSPDDEDAEWWSRNKNNIGNARFCRTVIHKVEGVDFGKEKLFAVIKTRGTVSRR